MAEIIMYLTADDTPPLLEWLNREPIPVLDPFSGWEQSLESDKHQMPWFPPFHTGTFQLSLKFQGEKGADTLARSGFAWVGNYFRAIGQPASPTAEKWWHRLRRFVKKESIGIPWPPDESQSKIGAYAFPKAYTDYREGRVLDANP